jgi:hypothetical protein
MTKLRTISASVVLFAFGMISSAVASNISKTFEIGPGTQYSSSNVRTFPIPCGRQVAAVVKFKRLGPESTFNDIPIKIEFREPDTAPNQEGPIIQTQDAKAKTKEQEVTMFSPGNGSSRGCDLPWRVRVKHANAGSPPYSVSGTIRLDYDGQTIIIPASDIGQIIPHSIKQINFGTLAGLQQGRIEVTASWTHLILGIPAPGDILLQFSIEDPSRTMVKFAEGYSNGSSSQPNLKLVYQVPKSLPGQWRLSIFNKSTTDYAGAGTPIIKFTPGCP